GAVELPEDSSAYHRGRLAAGARRDQGVAHPHARIILFDPAGKPGAILPGRKLPVDKGAPAVKSLLKDVGRQKARHRPLGDPLQRADGPRAVQVPRSGGDVRVRHVAAVAPDPGKEVPRPGAADVVAPPLGLAALL